MEPLQLGSPEKLFRSLMEAGRSRLTLFYVLSTLCLPAIWLGWKVYGEGWHKLGSVNMILGGAALIYVVIRKYASPPITSKLRGPNPFPYQDGPFLSKLCRSQALTELDAAISTGSVSTVFLLGPNGVGKTSLISGLRAQMVGKAVDPDPRFIHIEGNSSFLGNDLLESVNLRLDKGQPKFTTVESVMRSEDARKQVIVIDDAHLFGDPDELMEWVRWASEKVGTRGRKLILILDNKEHSERWARADWNNAQLFRYVFLSRFDDSNAKAVARALASDANLRLRKKLVDELVAGASVHADARVSPLSLSVMLEYIGKKPTGFLGFGVKDYRDAGYSAGILGAALQERLSEIYSDISSAICKAISHLLAANNNCFTVADLGFDVSARAEVLNALKHLSSPAMHVLRKSGDDFVVLDEWVPALQALHGTPEEGKVVCLSDYLLKKQEFWRHWPDITKGFFRRRIKNNYLLPSRGVSEIENTLSALLVKEENSHLLEYLAASKKHAKQRWLWRCATVAIIVGLISALLLFNHLHFGGRGKADSDHQLPKDFDQYASQLSDVSVVCMLESLERLPRGLTSLDLDCSDVTSLEGVPQKLVHLGLSLSNVENLKDVPESVRDLDFSGNADRNTEGIGQLNLTSLNLDLVPVADLNLLPRTVTKLRLSNPHIIKLDGLPQNLKELVLTGTGVDSLQGIPDRIRSLSLVDNFNLREIGYLPSHLRNLRTRILPRDSAVIPLSLETLFLESGGEVKDLPDVRELELANTRVIGPVSEYLEALKLDDPSSSAPFLPSSSGQVPLPGRLRFLKIRLDNGTQFGILPKRLLGLDLERSLSLESLAGLDLRISELNITNTGIRDLSNVPASVLTLKFELCLATDLEKFPPDLEELYLGGCSYLQHMENLPSSLSALDVHGTALSSLPRLPASLKSLDISNTQISGHLPMLPSGLEELTLHAGQVDTLRGLPPTVRKLYFRARVQSGKTAQSGPGRTGS